MTNLKLPSPISLGLILSYQCNAQCRHCMYACSPKWKGWISEERLEDILRGLVGKIVPSPYGSQTASLNYGLHFTGGEPFLNFPLLLKAVTIAAELKIPSTFVETNCFWCTADNVTEAKLRSLKEAGLKGILISVNPYYLEFVPFERTERGIKIAQQIFGDNLMIYQWSYYTAFRKLGIKGKISLEDYLKRAKGANLASEVELFLMGRATYQLTTLYPKRPPEQFFNEPCQPPFLREWHNHIDLYGNYLPGYCGGISLGNCQNLDECLENGANLEQRPILKLLTEQDFRGLFNFARDFGYSAPAEGCVSKCHLCLDIRRYLVTKREFEELEPKEFYSYLE